MDLVAAYRQTSNAFSIFTFTHDTESTFSLNNGVWNSQTVVKDEGRQGTVLCLDKLTFVQLLEGILRHRTVPCLTEGWEIAEGGEFSSYDFAVKKSDFYYFDFNTEADDDTMMQHYNYNKETYTNEQTDFDKTYGDNAWVGFQYSDGYGGYGFEAYMTLAGKIVRVSCAGYKFDSPEAEAILSSFAAK